jgi:FkbM family methyltransferase
MFVVLLAVLLIIFDTLAIHYEDHAPQVSKYTMPCRRHYDELTRDPYRDNKNGTILVIGANTGPSDSSDPSWEYLKSADHFHKIFIEPIPSIFLKLKENVVVNGVQNATFLNVAIATRVGETNMTLYCILDGLRKDVPFWADQICSQSLDRLYSQKDILHKDKHLKTNKEKIMKHISTHIVPTMTINKVLKGYVKSRVRVIQIDVEGFDDYIVKSLPLNTRKLFPQLIIFEHMLLNVSRYLSTLNFLHGHGYHTCIGVINSQNTYAYLPDYKKGLNWDNTLDNSTMSLYFNRPEKHRK